MTFDEQMNSNSKQMQVVSVAAVEDPSTTDGFYLVTLLDCLPDTPAESVSDAISRVFYHTFAPAASKYLLRLRKIKFDRNRATVS